MTNEQLRLRAIEQDANLCSDKCFKSMSDEEIVCLSTLLTMSLLYIICQQDHVRENMSDWSEVQESMLNCMFDVIDPDGIPCDLSLLILKPCCEV